MLKTLTFWAGTLPQNVREKPGTVAAAALPARLSTLGIRVLRALGVAPLAVEVAQEVLVVVGSLDPRRRLWPAPLQLGTSTRAALLEQPGDEVDRHGEERHDDQELEHPSRVGRTWSRTTLEA
jgi:hypothetical protein